MPQRDVVRVAHLQLAAMGFENFMTRSCLILADTLAREAVDYDKGLPSLEWMGRLIISRKTMNQVYALREGVSQWGYCLGMIGSTFSWARM